MCSQGALLVFVLIWAGHNIDVRFVVRGVLFTLVDAFFKTLTSGAVRPDDGPIILACARTLTSLLTQSLFKRRAKRRDGGF